MAILRVDRVYVSCHGSRVGPTPQARFQQELLLATACVRIRKPPFRLACDGVVVNNGKGVGTFKNDDAFVSALHKCRLVLDLSLINI